MIKNILLTGATGFLGSHLLKRLLELNYQVIVVKRSFSNTWRIDKSLGGVKVYDIDKVPLKKIFEENSIDCIIHLATHYKKKHEESDLHGFIDTNIKLPTTLLELMKEHQVRFFINTGTFFEYALAPEPIKENSAKKAYNLYAASKIAFTEILQYYSAHYSLKSIDLKLFSPYGPKDNEKLVVSLIKSSLQDTPLEISKGEQRWNWTYVKDIVEAYIRSINYFEFMDSNYEIFNIGNGEVHSIKTVTEAIESLSGKTGRFLYTKPYIKNEIFYVNCDNTKAKECLGWAPEYNLLSGLKETYQYYAGGKNG